LAAILILSAFLNLFRLEGAGYGVTYYAAAVKNMLTSWHNFFFVSFDAGFVTVDKPPLGLWIQAASAYLFGFNGLSLLVAQAMAGILSVALLYHLVSRAFGPVGGILAALALAVTPVAVGVERTNNSDGLLALTVLVAAWAVIRAVETGRLRWLLLCAVVVGLGFNIKMLEAFLSLPAFYLLYLLVSPVSWWRRFVHLGLATLVLLVVSLSWTVVVDLTPTDQRPYVGSSSNNSELNLAFGYNGATRLLGRGEGTPGGGEQGVQQASAMQENAQGGPPGGGGFGPGGARENGAPGPLRLLDEQLGGQIGWLLPLAVVGLLAAAWQRRPRLPLDREHQALVLWGMWLVTMGGFFSIAGMFHRYYLVMLAPAIAALVGIGVVRMWKDYRSPGWRGWLLPLALLGTATLQAYILSVYEDWSTWLTPAIVGLCLVAAVGLIVLRLRPRLNRAYATGAVAVGILALLIAPTAWATYTMWQSGGGMAGAGPRPTQGSSWGGAGGGPPGGPSDHRDTADPALLDYLQANRDNAKYLVATTNARNASPIILGTDEPDPVITLGGFAGRDPIFSTTQLANLVDEGAVRFFLISQGGWGGSSQNESTSWVQDNCAQVPKEQWQSSSTTEQGGDPEDRAPALYDCGTGVGSAD
jgi:4-amino-4-deoxy-L-arabinose transferase-like glycosyltransferase